MLSTYLQVSQSAGIQYPIRPRSKEILAIQQPERVLSRGTDRGQSYKRSSKDRNTYASMVDIKAAFYVFGARLPLCESLPLPL